MPGYIRRLKQVGMKQASLFTARYKAMYGYFIKALEFETRNSAPDSDNPTRALFGVSFSPYYFDLDLFFIRFNIFDNRE